MGILFFVDAGGCGLDLLDFLIEPVVAWLVESKGFSREKACVWSGLATWFLGLGTVFSLMSGLMLNFSTGIFFNCWIT